MKWKEFFASTLPRSRKSRRKSKSTSDKSSASDQSGSTSSPETDDVIVRKQKVRSDVINGNKKNQRPSTAVGNYNTHAYTQIAYNKYLVSEDFQYTDTNKNNYVNPYGHMTLSKAPSNASESGFEDSHESFVGFYDPSDRKYVYQPPETDEPKPDLLTSSHSFNTFPRERTRIKTNPWVSTSQYNTMTSSVHGRLETEPVYYCPSNRSCTPEPHSNTGTLTRSCNTNCNNGNCGHMSMNSSYYSNSYNPYPSFPDSLDTGNNSSQDRSRDDLRFDNGNDVSYSEDETGVLQGGNLVINLKTGDIFVKPKPVVSPISFQYEDDLEAKLEQNPECRKKKSRRKRDKGDKLFRLENDDMRRDWDDRIDDPLGNVLRGYCDVDYDRQHGRNKAIDWVEGDNTDSSDKEGTLTRGQARAQQWKHEANDCETFHNPYIENQSIGDYHVGNTGVEEFGDLNESEIEQEFTYTPYKNLYYGVGDDAYVPNRDSYCWTTKDVSVETSHPREATDSAYESSTLSSITGSSFQGHLSSLEKHDVIANFDPRPTTMPSRKMRKMYKSQGKGSSETKRSLEEIRYSLKEKVERLKAEKRLVDEKVREAQEEEEIRREEKARMQDEVTTLRKQVLLQTLHDLKDNLVHQSGRLQQAYDDVLDMQWLNAKLRRLRNTTV